MRQPVAWRSRVGGQVPGTLAEGSLAPCPAIHPSPIWATPHLGAQNSWIWAPKPSVGLEPKVAGADSGIFGGDWAPPAAQRCSCRRATTPGPPPARRCPDFLIAPVPTPCRSSHLISPPQVGVESRQRAPRPCTCSHGARGRAAGDGRPWHRCQGRTASPPGRQGALDCRPPRCPPGGSHKRRGPREQQVKEEIMDSWTVDGQQTLGCCLWPHGPDWGDVRGGLVAGCTDDGVGGTTAGCRAPRRPWLWGADQELPPLAPPPRHRPCSLCGLVVVPPIVAGPGRGGPHYHRSLQGAGGAQVLRVHLPDPPPPHPHHRGAHAHAGTCWALGASLEGRGRRPQCCMACPAMGMLCGTGMRHGARTGMHISLATVLWRRWPFMCAAQLPPSKTLPHAQAPCLRAR